jgi:hypothetical protein
MPSLRAREEDARLEVTSSSALSTGTVPWARIRSVWISYTSFARLSPTNFPPTAFLFSFHFLNLFLGALLGGRKKKLSKIYTSLYLLSLALALSIHNKLLFTGGPCRYTRMRKSGMPYMLYRTYVLNGNWFGMTTESRTPRLAIHEFHTCNTAVII